jgi:serine protease AprX
MANLPCVPLLVLALTAISASAAAQTYGKLDPIAQARSTLSAGQLKVVITARDSSSLTGVDEAVRQLGGTLGRALPIINARAAIVPNAELVGLASNAAVQHVAADRMIFAANERTAATVGASAVRQGLGLDGSGIGVAVIDSGITTWHDDLADSTGSQQRVDRFIDLVNQGTVPYDDYGHGTHVAGIIAGNGFDSSGARAGIAPGAHLVVLKVLDSLGRGRISDVIAALDYVLAHDSELNIRIVNLSIATAVTEPYGVDPLTQAAKRVVDHGIVVVAASGNAGRNAQGQTQRGGITAPGNAPWILTVGASSHMGTVDRSDDTMAAFSSRGPTTFDRAAKPDIVAPGVGTESLSAPNSTLYNALSDYLLSGTLATPYLPYLSLSGTSMATPVVSGTVALMLQANPALTPNAAKAILQYTAQVYAGYDALTQGAGFLNAMGAVQLASYLGSSPTGPAPPTEGWSGHLIWGNYRLGGGLLTATANAWLSGVVWGQPTTPSGQNVAWGAICTANCGETIASWASWQTSCPDPNCIMVRWGQGTSENVVWGTSCAGADCPLPDGSSYMVTFSTSDSGDTVVWGTTDGDTVVWGTGCTDASCQPVVWGRP